MSAYSKFSKVAGAVLAAVFVVATLPFETADAQVIPKIEYRNFQRAKLWTGLMNTGTHGPDRDGSRRSSMEGITYPGRGTRISGGIWGGRTWPGSNQWVQNYLLRTSAGRNLGTYIITKPDPSEGYSPEGGQEFNVSISALTHTPDITPVRYPVEDMVEGLAGVGFDTVHPTALRSLASWWPGQIPLAPDKVLEIHNWNWGTYMNPAHKRFGELVGVSHWTTEAGITGTKKIYQWSFRDWDDFVIVENIFENTGDTDGDGAPDLNGGAGLTLNDTYFSFVNLLWPTEGGTANRDRVTNARGYYYWLLRRSESETYTEVQDDVLRYTDAANYMQADPSYSDVAEAVGLKMHYAFDGDSPISSRDDTGDSHVPETQCCWGRQNFEIRGEIMAGQYVGFMPIDYDPTDGFANDTETYVAPRVAEQPFAAIWYTHKDDPSIERGDQTEDDIAHGLTSVALEGQRPSMMNLAGRTPFPDNPTEPLPVQPNPTRVGEDLDTPESPNWYSAVQTYGPYDLKPGDKVKIVTALVASMPVEENMWGWQRNIPQNFDDLHTDKATKLLVKHANAAKEMYALGFDVPLPPPDVVLSVTNTPEATAQLSWGSIDDLEDPDYAGTAEAKDIAGYRVYRSDFYIDDWKLLKDIKVGDAAHLSGSTYTYVDESSLAGFEYYYAVTAYDTGHDDYKGRGPVPSLESGLAALNQFFPVSKTPVSPAVAANPTANKLEAPVAVIPNPFLADGKHAYEGSDKIRFTNLPTQCYVRIFSASGDLVADFRHDDDAIGEHSYLQLSREVTGQISAGVYFFVVKSETPASMGKIQRGTFVVVGGSVR